MREADEAAYLLLDMAAGAGAMNARNQRRALGANAPPENRAAELRRSALRGRGIRHFCAHTWLAVELEGDVLLHVDLCGVAYAGAQESADGHYRRYTDTDNVLGRGSGFSLDVPVTLVESANLLLADHAAKAQYPHKLALDRGAWMPEQKGQRRVPVLPDWAGFNWSGTSSCF